VTGALLTSHPAGVTDYVHANFQNPAARMRQWAASRSGLPAVGAAAGQLGPR
jgi:hypothetical protein